MAGLLYYMYEVKNKMNKEIHLFSVGSFEITPIDEKPILFKHGEIVTCSAKTIIVPSPTGLYDLAKQVHKDADKTGELEIISNISYRDNTLSKVLQAFKSKVPKQKEGTIGLYELTNHFEFNTNFLPKHIDQLGGEFVFNLGWSEDSNRYSGNIINMSLPIYEQTGR